MRKSSGFRKLAHACLLIVLASFETVCHASGGITVNGKELRVPYEKEGTFVTVPTVAGGAIGLVPGALVGSLACIGQNRYGFCVTKSGIIGAWTLGNVVGFPFYLLKKAFWDGPRYLVSGPPSFDRTLAEVNDLSRTDAARLKAAIALREFATQDNYLKYAPLLHHKDPPVQRIAADIICKAARTEDSSLLIAVLQNKTADGELCVIRTMGRNWNSAFGPILIDTLLHHPSEIVRAQAATVLGKQQVPEALPVLQEISRKGMPNDRNGEVQRAATDAATYFKFKKE